MSDQEKSGAIHVDPRPRLLCPGRLDLLQLQFSMGPPHDQPQPRVTVETNPHSSPWGVGLARFDIPESLSFSIHKIASHASYRETPPPIPPTVIDLHEQLDPVLL